MAKKWLYVFFAILLAIFFVNTFHEKYPDEFDSIVGGRYITELRIPYRDWFQHHQPGAYLLAAFLLPFSGISFVKFRVLLAFVWFGIAVSGYGILRKLLPQRNLSFYLFFLVSLALGATYWWGHMLLADTLSSYLILPAYTLLLLKEYYGERFDEKDLWTISLFAFAVWFTSMTYFFVVAGLVAYAIYKYIVWQKEKRIFKSLGRALLIVGWPYVVFFLFLAIVGGLKDWYFANITYNQDFYIYNYPRAPGAPVNPIRYAIVIANTFLNNYLPALWGVAGLPLSNPFQVTLAVSQAALAFLLIITKRYAFLVPFLITLVFSNARSNPQMIRETDYQASVYIVTSMFAGAFTLFALRDLLDRGRLVISAKLASSGVFLLLGILWVFTPIYLFLKFTHVFYPKYMGTAPLIYDRPQVAFLVNQLAGKDDSAWVGPFAFEELFYLKTKKNPSKYHWFLDHAARSKIGGEIVADHEKSRPKVIVFDRKFAPWGGDASTYNSFYTSFLDREYFRIFKLNEESGTVKYRWKIDNPLNYDLDGDFNFARRRKDEILVQLLSLGMIEEILGTK